MKAKRKWLFRSLVLSVLVCGMSFSAWPAAALENEKADAVTGQEARTQVSEPDTEAGTEAVQPTLDHDELTLYTGSTLQLAVLDSQSPVEWSAKVPSVAAVDSQGRITGLKAGKTRIFAKVEGLTLVCIVTVENPVLSEDSLIIGTGTSAQLKVEGTQGTVTWGSGSAKVASVTTTGKVNGLKKGSAAIHAKVTSPDGAEKTLACKVTVEEPVISSEEELLIRTEKLALTVSGTTDTVIWTSSNPKVASVSSTGTVTAQAAGTATVSAQARGKKLDCSITVEAPKLNKNKLILVKGGKGKLKVTGTTQPVSWSVSKSAVLKVSKGKVTAKKKGTAAVYASIHGIKLKAKVTVEAPSLSENSVVLVVGDSSKVDLNGTTQKVTWSSADESVVRVGGEGKNNATAELWARKKGSTVIKAKVGGVSYACNVKVENPVISKKSAVMLTGQKKTLKVKGTTGKVKWKSSKKSVASVSSKGVVTAGKKGSAVITATVRGKKLTCKIKVEDPSLNKNSLTLIKGTKAALKLSGTTQKVKWKSSDKSTATVTSGGKVKAVRAGSAVISATVLGKAFSCRVTVEAPSLSESTYQMDVGDSHDLLLSGTTLAVTWKSSASDIVTVTGSGTNNRYGTIKALDKGTATITASVGKKKYTCKVTVKKPVTSVELSYSTLTLKKGESHNLSVVWEPKDTTDDTTAHWSSSNTAIATVENGKVTAVSQGSAIISVQVGDKVADCRVIVSGPTLEENYQIIKDYLNANGKRIETKVEQNGLTYDLIISLQGSYIHFEFKRQDSSSRVVLTLNTNETTYQKMNVTFVYGTSSVTVIGTGILNAATYRNANDAIFRFSKLEGITEANALLNGREYLRRALNFFDILLKNRTGVDLRGIGFQYFERT